MAWSTNIAWSHDLDEVFGTHSLSLGGSSGETAMDGSDPGTGTAGAAGRGCAGPTVDRDRAVEVIATASGEGELTPTSTTRRVEQAMTASTYHQLDSVVADLPGTRPPAPPAPPAAEERCPGHRQPGLRRGAADAMAAGDDAGGHARHVGPPRDPPGPGNE